MFPVCLSRNVDVECLFCPALSVFSGSPVTSVSLRHSVTQSGPGSGPDTPHSTLVSCCQSNQGSPEDQNISNIPDKKYVLKVKFYFSVKLIQSLNSCFP